MKFKLIENLIESLKSLTSQGKAFATYSANDVASLIDNKPMLYRIAYDSKQQLWVIGDGTKFVHFDLFKKAFEQGLYDDLADYVKNNCNNDWETYLEIGDSGDDYVHNNQTDKYIFYLISIPTNIPYEETKSYIDSASWDSFNVGYKYPNFIIGLRKWNCPTIPEPLLKVLGEPESIGELKDLCPQQSNESLTEEVLNNKTYIFRGESNNKYQKNYHNREKDGLNSRYYSWEAFDGIYKFGNVVVYELLDESNILFYDDSSEEFCHEYNLMNNEYPLLYKRYGVKCLNEIDNQDFDTERPTVKLDRHDAYHAFQLVATIYLESDKRYSGCSWYEWMDTPEVQLQIWDDSIVRRLPYKEAKEVCTKLAEENPDMYKFTGDIWDKNFELHR